MRGLKTKERVNGWNLKAVAGFFVIVLILSLFTVLIAAIQYGFSYRKVQFAQRESRFFFLELKPVGPTRSEVVLFETTPISTPIPRDSNPVKNTTRFSNGSKFESVQLSDGLFFFLKTERQ